MVVELYVCVRHGWPGMCRLSFLEAFTYLHYETEGLLHTTVNLFSYWYLVIKAYMESTCTTRYSRLKSSLEESYVPDTIEI